MDFLHKDSIHPTWWIPILSWLCEYMGKPYYPPKETCLGRRYFFWHITYCDYKPFSSRLVVLYIVGFTTALLQHVWPRISFWRAKKKTPWIKAPVSTNKTILSPISHGWKMAGYWERNHSWKVRHSFLRKRWNFFLRIWQSLCRNFKLVNLRTSPAFWGSNIQPTNQPTNQPASQPASQPANQPASQPPNQPTNQPTTGQPEPTCEGSRLTSALVALKKLSSNGVFFSESKL